MTAVHAGGLGERLASILLSDYWIETSSVRMQKDHHTPLIGSNNLRENTFLARCFMMLRCIPYLAKLGT